jgi:hypothetical protein
MSDLERRAEEVKEQLRHVQVAERIFSSDDERDQEVIDGAIEVIEQLLSENRQDDATLEKVEAKVMEGMEQAWWHGNTGKPSPQVSKTLGYVIGEVKNVFHAAVKREARRILAENDR